MSQPRPIEDKPFLGILIMCVAVFGFTMIDSSAKWLAQSGMAALQIVFVRYVGHLAVTLATFLPREGVSVFIANRPKIQLLRALALLGSTFFNFMAVSYLPLNVTTAIMFASPVVVSLYAIPILGEKIGLRRFMAIIVGFVGVIVIVQPWGVAFRPAMLFSLGALLSASFYFVLTRMIAGEDGNATSQVWSAGLATIVLAPFAWVSWKWPETTVDYVVMGLIGCFGAFSHIAVTYAHRLAPASTLAPIVYIQVIFVTIISYVIFATLPDTGTIIGTGIIIASGIYIWHRERVLYRNRATPSVEASIRR